MALHIGDYLGLPGNSSGWDSGTAQAQGAVTDLTPHVDGGSPTGVTNTNSGADKSVLYWSAGIVVLSGLLLWFLGGVVFRSVRL